MSNTKDTPIDNPEKQWMHYQLYDAISKIPNGLDFLNAVNEGISENRSLKLELQKQKELNAELVKGLTKIYALGLSPLSESETLTVTKMFAVAGSLIKKSSEI